jgi:uncharacterized membrane protein YfcA
MTIIVMVVIGALCGGFVTGLAGFGTGLTALGVWLYVVDPVTAAALVVVCSLVGQVQSLYTLRRRVAWHRAWPFVLGGLVGVPVGVAVLRAIDPKTLKICLGMFLVSYTGWRLSARPALVRMWGGQIADGLVGFGGGVLGGVAGLSGPLPTIWCGLRGWPADVQRGVYQPYNLTILGIVLCVYTTQGVMTPQTWGLALICLPATLLGAYLGTCLYGQVNEQQFRTLVLSLLFVSGMALMVSNLT